MSSKRKEAAAEEVGGFPGFLSLVPLAWWVFAGNCGGAEEMLDMLTRLLVLASLPLLLLEEGWWEGVDEGVSKGFVLVGGATCGGGGSTGRLVRGTLEGVALEGVAGIGVGRSRRCPLNRGEVVKMGGGGDEGLKRGTLSIEFEGIGERTGGGVRDFRTDSRNIFSAVMHDAGRSWSIFLAA